MPDSWACVSQEVSLHPGQSWALSWHCSEPFGLTLLELPSILMILSGSLIFSFTILLSCISNGFWVTLSSGDFKDIYTQENETHPHNTIRTVENERLLKRHCFSYFNFCSCWGDCKGEMERVRM